MKSRPKKLTKDEEVISFFMEAARSASQIKRGGSVSVHYNSRHPAVAAVACPVKGCERAAGVPCVRARDGQRREGHGTETHVARVRKFEREALPGEPGSVLPPSPVDTDNDCAP